MSARHRSRLTALWRQPRIWRHLSCLAALLSLPACASFSPDGGMSVPRDIAAQHLRKDVVAIRTDEDTDAARVRVDQLIKRPLTAETAVQVALLNNRGLQAAYNELGIAEAQRIQQSLPPNPSFSISRLSGAAEIEIERQIAGNILALLTLPARADIATERFHRAQLAAALETLRVAAEARKAFYRAVAARQQVGLLEQASAASGTTAELAKRMGESGAMNKLDQSRQQLLHAELSTELARARQRATSERERLIRALGLSGKDLAFKLPSSLPPLPRRAPALQAVEQRALDSRVDLQIAKSELDAIAKSNGLTKATRFINVIEGGYLDKVTEERATGEHKHQSGYELTLQVPIFDFGEVRVREAEQTYMQAVNRLAREGGQRPLGSARGLSRLSRRLRHRRALPARGAAAAQDHLRRNAAALQRHAGRRLRAADRSAPADRRQRQRDRGATRFLARQRRSASGDHRRRHGSAAETQSTTTASAAGDEAGRDIEETRS